MAPYISCAGAVAIMWCQPDSFYLNQKKGRIYMGVSSSGGRRSKW